jgi:prepilin-type N-terminal cleavage/methylation domain-containing protein
VGHRLTDGNDVELRSTVGRWRTRRRPDPADREAGFTLIEMVIALSLLVIVLPIFALTITGTTNATNDARLRQVATAVADTALDNARSVSAASLANDGTAAGTTPSVVDLTATTGSIKIPQQTTVLDSHTFTSTLYVGSCYLQTTGSTSGQCTTTTSSYPMERVIAYVAWTAPNGCSANACTYVTSTLLATSTNDPTVNINPNSTPPAPATVTTTVTYSCSGLLILNYCFGSVTANINVSWTASTPTGTQQAVTGYLATATPSGGSALTCSANASATTCSITGATRGSSYSLIVQANSSAGYSTPSTAVTVTT